MTNHIKSKKTTNQKPSIDRINKKILNLEECQNLNFIKSDEELKLFMSWHIFTVWIYISMIKRLQLEFTCPYPIWAPYSNTKSTSIINKIVSYHEGSEPYKNEYLNHYSLYLLAMQEIGKDTISITTFVDLLEANMPVKDALEIANVATALKKFILESINLIISGSIEEILGCMICTNQHIFLPLFTHVANSTEIKQVAGEYFLLYDQKYGSANLETRNAESIALLLEQTGENEAYLNIAIQSVADTDRRYADLWNQLKIEIKKNRHSIPETM
ncbi:DUF3050 domain-containing protein [Alcaligenes nematophilus]|uniref:DUF3050 domain-containing protein n=1 Tax=Alcaligenes sp. PF14 TaxID=3120297 RepID=UPI003016E657